MKKVIFLAALLCAGLAAYSQDISQKDVPSVVLNGFQQKFPNADDVEWEKENDRFKVEFEIGKTDHKAWLDQTGKIVMHGLELEERELPEPVKTAINRDYNGYDIEDVTKIEETNAVTYAVELEKGNEEITVVFKGDGSKK